MEKRLVVTGSTETTVRVAQVQAALQALAVLTDSEKTAVIVEMHREMAETEETKSDCLVVQATAVWRGMCAARSEMVVVKARGPAKLAATIVQVIRGMPPEIWETWALALMDEQREAELARAQAAERARE